MPLSFPKPDLILEEAQGPSASHNADFEPSRYFGSFVDKRTLSPLRPAYAFPRLYQTYLQAMFEKFRSIRYVDMLNDMDEIMHDMSPERDNKLKITSCAVEATVEDLITSCMICLSSSQDLYLDLSEVSGSSEEIAYSLEILFESFFDVELCSVR
jgi:hypothetical protein